MEDDSISIRTANSKKGKVKYEDTITVSFKDQAVTKFVYQINLLKRRGLLQ